MDNGSKAILGVGIAAVVGGVAYYAFEKSKSQPPSSCSVATLQLSASPTTTEPGGTVAFTAIATDTNGNPVSGASVTLVEVTTNTSSTPATTDSSGTADFSVTFPSDTQTGNYVFEAEAC
ncbi:MAG: hypothetical protein ACP5RE_03515 [Candidatus Acidifodinimicrobium sp.]